MDKEIVIAAYNEIIDWVPNHLKNISLIYRCGQPTKKRENFNSSSPNHNDNNFYEQLNKLKALHSFCKEMYNLNIDNEQYNEQFDKIKQTDNCRKSREAKQWLNHIISRYHCLADITIFLQAIPFDHCKDTIQIINNLNYVCFMNLPIASPRENRENLVTDFWLSLSGKVPEKVCWSPGAQFAIHKSVIQSKPIDWYRQIDELASQTDRSGEILERTWWNVFGEPEITEIS